MPERLFCSPEKCNEIKCSKCKEKKSCNSSSSEYRRVEQGTSSIKNSKHQNDKCTQNTEENIDKKGKSLDRQSANVSMRSARLYPGSITYTEKEKSLNQLTDKNRKNTKEKQKESKSSIFKKRSDADKSLMGKRLKDIKTEKSEDLLFNLDNCQIMNSTFNERDGENLQSKSVKDVSKKSLNYQPSSKSNVKRKNLEDAKMKEKISKGCFDKKDKQSADYASNSADLTLPSKTKEWESKSHSSFWKRNLKPAKTVNDSDSSSSASDFKKKLKKKTCTLPKRSFEPSTSSRKNASLPDKKEYCSLPRCPNKDSEKLLFVHSASSDSDSETSSENSSYDENDPRIITFITQFAKIKINLKKLWKFMNNGNFRIIYGPSFDESIILVVENTYDYLRRLGTLN